MNDFASAAMVQILIAGMRLEGLQAPAPPVHGARVPLAFKRQLVESAVRQGGWDVLPRLGRGLAVLEGTPIYQALAVSPSPADMVARWCRMERYIHSRHRVHATPAGSQALALTHAATLAHPPPLPAENLVVMGVIAAALEIIGAKGVAVHMGDTPVYPRAAAGAVTGLAARAQTAHWRLSWQSVTPCVHNPELAEPAMELTRHDAPAVKALRALLLRDLMTPPALPDAARQMRRAPRSLQRELAGHGQSYSAVVAHTRCLAAAWYLVHTRHSTAETGFMCGFSDQAHFTRTFTRAVGLPPGRYRKEFELSPGGQTPSLA